MSEMSFPEPKQPVEATDPTELQRAVADGEAITLLDVRAPADYEAWHIEGAGVTDANVPYYEFLENDVTDILEQVPDDENLIVVCAKGKASEYVASLLNEHGYAATMLDEGMHGWARLYDHTDVALESGTTVRQYHRPSSGCLAYMIYDGCKAVVVDPLRAFTERYVADAQDLGLDITAVLDSHVHADHISGARELAAETDARLLLPDRAVARGVTYDGEFETVTDGDTLTAAEATIDAVGAPGHTSGMMAYLVDGEMILTGDTLFIDNVARPDLEEGDEGAPEAAAQLYETLQQRILSLPGETLVGAAHVGTDTDPREDGAYLATLDEVTATLDVLSADEETFVEQILSNMPPQPANFEQIIAINLGQETADADEAFELELGPSNCAASA